jgi:hypothetical protein
MAQECLACHTDVASQVRDRTGLHGVLVGQRTSPTCRGCHPEHRGSAAPLTDVDPRTFPHDLTGYSLAGHEATPQGAAVTCAQCHPRGLASFEQATCTGCHRRLNPAFMGTHVASFGARCLSCHDGSGRFGSDFDHSKLKFKLVGAHASVACSKCHPNMSSLAAMRATPQDCRSCHARSDVHKGAFGTQCGQCHTPVSWLNASFDHSVFPLDHGADQQRATCATCHPKGLSTYTCFGCHAHTPANIMGSHEGRSAAQLANCIECHRGGGTGGD